MKYCGDWPDDTPSAIVTDTQLDDVSARSAPLTAAKSPDGGMYSAAL